MHSLVSGATDPVGGGAAHNTLQPSLGSNYIIAAADSSLVGQVTLFGGNFAPAGWLPADGSSVPISEYPELFGVLGKDYGGDGNITFGLPDLRGRAAVGAGQGVGLTNRLLGQEFGAETATLTIAHLPSHDHSLSPSGMTSAAGGGAAHPTVQPSTGLNYIIALAGTDPTQGGGLDGVPLVGELTLYAGATAPAGWSLADGSLLPITGNEVLFDVLGFTFGGDGDEMFALPDLRGRAAIGAGQGVGLTNRALGDEIGSESVTLSIDELPAHAHTYGEYPVGDYNRNGIVDAADYTVWRNSVGTANLAADGNGDEVIDGLDLAVWKMHYGETSSAGSGQASADAPAVPEPTTGVLWLAGWLYSAARRRWNGV
jgi:microcystin-dependent protein